MTEVEELKRADQLASTLRVVAWLAGFVGVAGLAISYLSHSLNGEWDFWEAIGLTAVLGTIVVGVWGALLGIGALLGLQVRVTDRSIAAGAAPIPRQQGPGTSR